MEKRDININHNKLTKNQIYLKHISDFKNKKFYFLEKVKILPNKKKIDLLSYQEKRLILMCLIN